MMHIGQIVTYGIHTGPIRRILVDEQSQVFYEVEHVAEVLSEGGVRKKVKTWVKEQDLSPATES